MGSILVSTVCGLRVISRTGKEKWELPGLCVTGLASEDGDVCFGIVAGRAVWRRSKSGKWRSIGECDFGLASIVPLGKDVLCGSMADARLSRMSRSGQVSRIEGFDVVQGRGDWFPQGPPLHVRSMATSADGAVFAAVHVGGIPVSRDGCKTWVPTVPVEHDVHEVKVHESGSIVAASCALGLYVSEDVGRTWRLYSEGPLYKDSLSLAIVGGRVLFSVQDGPFAKRSQIWTWKIGGDQIEQVQAGLPEWLSGKVDTGHISSRGEVVAIVDGGGNLWCSESGGLDWALIASGVHGATGVVVL